MTTFDETLDKLKQRLARALSQKALLREKSRLLEEELAQARAREGNSTELVQQLIERQRELNVMLNRSNIMLNRAQEVNSLLSLEFNEVVQALPEPQRKEKEERISRIQELFRKTGALEQEEDQPAALESKIEGIDAEFSTLEHADRRKTLWGADEQEAAKEPPPAQTDEQEVSESSAVESQPEDQAENPSTDLDSVADLPPEQPVEPDVPHDELSKEPVVLGRRGYPIGPDNEEEEGTAICAALAEIKIFPPKLRRWLQRVGRD